MSAENIEAIGNLYRAMNDRDPEAIADLVHPTGPNHVASLTPPVSQATQNVALVKPRP